MSTQDLESLTVFDLRGLCKEKGLPSIGLKKELIERLQSQSQSKVKRKAGGLTSTTPLTSLTPTHFTRSQSTSASYALRSRSESKVKQQQKNSLPQQKDFIMGSEYTNLMHAKTKVPETHHHHHRSSFKKKKPAVEGEESIAESVAEEEVNEEEELESQATEEIKAKEESE